MTGLREDKKRRTRETIAQAAVDLFAERGFDSVTVEDVARAADVSRQTVFNYFPTKEQMLFDRDPEVEAALVAAVRDRPAGSSPVDAFRGHTHRFWERMQAVLNDGPLPHGFWEIVRASPTLRDYAEATFARQARSVARALAQEHGWPDDDAISHAMARALCGVNAAMLVSGLERLASGEPPGSVIPDTIAQADRAYDLLAHGLGDF
jgi:AcrR family transcriptional regulator